MLFAGEECSYSSEIDQTDSQNDISDNNTNNNGYEYDYTPTVILNPTCGASDRSNLINIFSKNLFFNEWIVFVLFS